MSSEQAKPEANLTEEQAARKATWKVMRKKALVWIGFPLITLMLLGLYPGGEFKFSVMYLSFLVVYAYILWSEWNSCMESEKRHLTGLDTSPAV
jgi:hypothetical protein